MKSISLFTLTVVTFAFVSIATPVSALSCLHPVDNFDWILESEDTIIFTGAATEHSKQNSEGYAEAANIAVDEVWRGNVPTSIEVAYPYDDTWGYMCTGAPLAVGEEGLFVVYEDESTGEYRINSQLSPSFSDYETLFEKMRNAELSPTEPLATKPEVVVESEIEQRNDLYQRLVALVERIQALLSL